MNDSVIGDATVAAFQCELVSARGWINTTHFGLCYALGRVTPGTKPPGVLYCDRLVIAPLARGRGGDFGRIDSQLHAGRTANGRLRCLDLSSLPQGTRT